jgi:3-oxoacyl-[acyl-carrier protein] reductase
MNATPDLAGRVALVTGGARRTGRVLSKKLAAAGASVVVNARSSRAEAESLAKEIEAAHGAGRAMAFMADVSDPKAVDAMFAAAVARFGRLDILVNNASIRRHGAMESIEMDAWHDILHTTLDGTFLCCRAAAPHMKKAGAGTIINMGGVSAAAVITAKSGLFGLTRALAHDLGPMGITINIVAPASMIDEHDDPKRIEALKSFYRHDQVPLGRTGTVEEVADAIVTLCGPAWRYMTGQVIHINGGVFFGS